MQRRSKSGAPDHVQAPIMALSKASFLVERSFVWEMFVLPPPVSNVQRTCTSLCRCRDPGNQSPRCQDMPRLDLTPVGKRIEREPRRSAPRITGEGFQLVMAKDNRVPRLIYFALGLHEFCPTFQAFSCLDYVVDWRQRLAHQSCPLYDVLCQVLISFEDPKEEGQEGEAGEASSPQRPKTARTMSKRLGCHYSMSI